MVDSTVLSFFLAAPPLTLENVLSVVKGVRNWRTLAKQLVMAYDKDDDENKYYIGATDLDALQREHGSDEDCLKTVVRQFLQEGGGRYRPASWRAVIWCLYKANEIQLANQIRSYGEQLEGVCFCIQNTTGSNTHSTYLLILNPLSRLYSLPLLFSLSHPTYRDLLLSMYPSLSLLSSSQLLLTLLLHLSLSRHTSLLLISTVLSLPSLCPSSPSPSTFLSPPLFHPLLRWHWRSPGTLVPPLHWYRYMYSCHFSCRFWSSSPVSLDITSLSVFSHYSL